MPTDAEISRIIELHESGKSQREIADEIGKSQPTINNWIKDLIKKGLIKTDRSATKNATAAKAVYDLARRRALSDKLFQILEESLEGEVSPNDLRNHCVSFGILEDKRRLIDPENMDETKTGLEEMREEIHKARHNDLETSAS